MIILLYISSIFLLSSAAIPPERNADPVVLKGKDVTELYWKHPDDIVGFNHDGTQWNQVPIQVDEVHYQLWDNIKNKKDCK